MYKLRIVGPIFWVWIACGLGSLGLAQTSPKSKSGKLSETVKSKIAADKNGATENKLPNLDAIVPQTLLNLLHAPEVQKEIGIQDRHQAALEDLFSKIDGPWWRARNLPIAERIEVTRKAEQEARKWLVANVSRDALSRLEQIELRSQGTRALLRSDITQKLGLPPTKFSELATLVRGTEEASKKLYEALKANKADESHRQALRDAQQKEAEALPKLLNEEQSRALALLIGAPFDTASLQRIYPMAPEIEPVEHWINSSPLTLKQLRGKVVILHFYAFQCINCQRNLPIYGDWHKEFAGKDVVVLGIQRPETQAEADPEAVKAAAIKEKIEYPVMLDLESKNWNSWSNTMWPTVYVIDKKGFVRSWWQGELKWQGATGDQQIHDLVKKLMGE